MWKIALSDLRLDAQDHAAVLAALASNWLTMGERTQAFERAFAVALDPGAPPHAFAVSNCTVALHLALEAIGVGPGDEVIVPALTFVATANAALYTGATVVLADVTSPDDLTLSVADVAAKLTPRTRAVLPVHYAGHPADMAALRALCQLRGVAIVEDVAHAPLADAELAEGPQALGTIGAVGCFSFFSNKNLATGEGGMIVTRDDALAERIALLRSHGMTSLTLDRHRGHANGYDVVALGHNARMDELRAALGLSQLSRLPANNALRVERVGWYRDRLAEVAGLAVPFAGRVAVGRQAPHILPVLLPEGCPRAAVQAAMKADGIQTSVHYTPIHRFSFHAASDRVMAGELPHTEAVADRLLTLPLSPTLTEADVQAVVDSLGRGIAAAVGGGPEAGR